MSNYVSYTAVKLGTGADLRKLMGEDSGGYLKQGVWGHSYRVFYVYNKVIDNATVRNYIKRGQKWV